MAEKRDYYEVLGVTRTVTTEEIKVAFRNKARQYHPDINREAGAEDKFKEVNEAYQVLSDADKRAAYDRYGHAGVSGMGNGFDFTQVDLSDILGDLFGFGGFGGFGGQSRSRSRTAPRRGADLQTTVKISFDEACHGTEKEIEFARDEKCTRCNGNGAEPGTSPQRCSACNGTGEVKTTRQTMFGNMVQVAPCPTCGGRGETIASPCTQCHGRGIERKNAKKRVKIPAGVDTGTRIRLSGEGQPGQNNGPSGDLYIDLQVTAHPFFRRQNEDVLLEVNINVAQASLGDKITIPTIDGDELFSIPEGTQPGTVFTMKGKGIPNLHGNGRGDQRLVVNVAIPKSLTPAQRDLFDQLGETLGTDVIPQEKSFWDRLKDAF